jgi:hypothetical protein
MPLAAITSVSAQGIDYQWYSENGTQRHTGTAHWPEIHSIEVFKRDLFTYDLICLQVRTKESSVEFDEEDLNWTDLMIALPTHLHGCKPWGEWFTNVAFPAFETKRQKVFERQEGD